MSGGIEQIIRDNVAAVIRSSGLSDREVAQRIGCSERHVRRVRLGHSPAGRRFTEDFSRAFRIPAWQLYRPIGVSAAPRPAGEPSDGSSFAGVFLLSPSSPPGPMGLPVEDTGSPLALSGVGPDAFGLVASEPLVFDGLVREGAVLVVAPSLGFEKPRLSVFASSRGFYLGLARLEGEIVVFDPPGEAPSFRVEACTSRDPGSKFKVLPVAYVLEDAACVRGV